jgi:hypothetical protein
MTREQIYKIIENEDIEKFNSLKNVEVYTLINMVIDVKIYFGIMFFTSKMQKIAWKKLKRGEYRQNMVEL